MISRPQISIVITTCNGSRFLRQQLDSIYAQTMLPQEVLVSDDGSTDDTLAILEEYHQRYGLFYSSNPGPHGVNANFMRAFRLCSGEYVMICDQDDIWWPNKVATLYQAIRFANPDTPVAVSSTREDIDAQGRCIRAAHSYPRSEGWESTLLDTGCSQGCTMVMNRCLVDRVLDYYDTKPLSDELMYDVLVSLIAAVQGQKINLGIPLMSYRHHADNQVDPIRTHRYTFWAKVKDMPTYYPFLLDYRIRELAVADALFESETIAPDIRLFLSRMTQLHHEASYRRGLAIIGSLPQITTGRKWKIRFLTPIVIVLKYLQSHLSLA